MAVWAWVAYAAAMLPFVGVAIAVLYAGYVAYETEQIRRRRAAEPPRPDPLAELSRLDVEIAEQLARARLTLEAAQATVRRGTRG